MPFVAVLSSYGWLLEWMLSTVEGRLTFAEKVYAVWYLTLLYILVMVCVWCLIAWLWNGHTLLTDRSVTTIYMNESVVQKALVIGYWSGNITLLLIGTALIVVTTLWLVFNAFSTLMPSWAAIALTSFLTTYPIAAAVEYNTSIITFMDVEAQGERSD